MRRAFLTRLSLSTTTPRSNLAYVTLDRGQLINEEGDELFEASAFVTPLSAEEEEEETEAPAAVAATVRPAVEEPRSANIAGSLE